MMRGSTVEGKQAGWRKNVEIIPNTSQPTTWLPLGSPDFACKETALDLVTMVARMTKPICYRQ